jgi:methyl-accepting chemotaxis protein
MASKFSNKLYTLIFTILSVLLIITSVVVFFVSIKPFLLEQKIIKYNNILLPESEYTQNQLNQAITLSQLISSNIKNFYTPNSSAFLSDEYLQTVSTDILKNNYYILGIGYIINSDIELSLTNEDYIIDDMYSAIWQKNFNKQITIQHFSLKDINNPNLLLEAKHKKHIIIGKPFLYNRQGENSLIQPIASPIYVGDKFIGIDVVLLSLDFMDEIYKFHVGDLQASKLILFNKDGIILFYHLKLNIGNSIESIIPQESVKLLKAAAQKEAISDKFGNYFVVCQYINTPQIDQYWIISLFTPYTRITTGIYIFLLLLILGSLIISGIVVLAVSLLTTSYSNVFNSLHKSITNIYKGHLEQPVEIISSYKETENITRSLERLRLRLLTLIELHHKLADRLYSDRLSPTNPGDLLAKSINTAFEKIIKRWQDRQEIEESKRRSDWINKGLSEIYEATRVSENSFKLLGEQILDTYIKHS